MLELFVSAFVTLFVVIDPLGCAPIYAGLSAGASAAQRRSVGIRPRIIAGVTRALFLGDAARHAQRYAAHEHTELRP